MSKHVSEWLNAYYDGELHGHRLHLVEEHLAGCDLCQAEFESLEKLSSLLHEVPTPEFTYSERFISQVNLRLPYKQPVVSRRRILEFGWWIFPVGLLASWAFISTALILSDVLSVAVNMGMLSGLSNWLSSGPASDVYLSTTVGQMGLLSGNGLNWAETTETFARTSFPQFVLQFSIALLYLSWMAIWWARHTRQEHGPLLEG